MEEKEMSMHESIGQVQIADDVIAVIAEIAALEVEGMISVGQSKNDFVQSIRGKKAAKGIHVEVIEDEVYATISGTVAYGAKIREVCVEVQQKVKNSIETMTGLTVHCVDVHVIGVQQKLTEEY
jgi:uncharacterized alkaline shock family protein YloU